MKVQWNYYIHERIENVGTDTTKVKMTLTKVIMYRCIKKVINKAKITKILNAKYLSHPKNLKKNKGVTSARAKQAD